MTTPQVSPKSPADLRRCLLAKGFSETQAKRIEELNIRDSLKKQNSNIGLVYNKSNLSNEPLDSSSSESKDLHPKISETIGSPTSVNIIPQSAISYDIDAEINSLIAHSDKFVSLSEVKAESLPAFVGTFHHHHQPDKNISNKKLEEDHAKSSIELLLSLQKSTHGINMYDIITPDSEKRIRNLMKQQGYSYDDAALIMFEKFTSNFQSVQDVSNQNNNSINAPPLTVYNLKSISLDSSSSQRSRRRQLNVKAKSDGVQIRIEKEEQPIKEYVRTTSENSLSPSSVSPPRVRLEKTRTNLLSRRNPFAQVNPSLVTNTATTGMSGTGQPIARRSSSGSSKKKKDIQRWDSEDFFDR